MRIGGDGVLQALVGLAATPHVGVGEEEDLAGRELVESGQPRLDAVLGLVVDVGAEGLAQSAVVGDVLALRVDAVQLQTPTRCVLVNIILTLLLAPRIVTERSSWPGQR